MDKIKLLTSCVIILVLLNVSILAFVVLSKPPHHPIPLERQPKPKEVVVEKLHFDKEQIKKYDILIQSEQKTVDSIDYSMKNAHNQLYKLLSKKTIDEKVKDSLLLIIAQNQKRIETCHFKHFQDIKNLCNSNQIEDFNEMSSELARIFSKNKPPGRRN